MRTIYIDSPGAGSRELRVSYIRPVAIWKSSYRLLLQDSASLLEGWAIVDNTTGEDWNDVQLSVVSVGPSPSLACSTPRVMASARWLSLPEDRAAGPLVYSGSINGPLDTGGQGKANGFIAGSGGGVGGGVYRTRPQSAAEAALQTETAGFSASSVEGASGATLGELFEYSFAGPITIRKNQSAMLPFLQDKIPARKLLIYTERDGEHPVNAVEITNETSKTLDEGPITVYDAGAYAGEALFETLKAGDKRLIGYAVDYGTRITSAFDSSARYVREVHVENGMLQVRYGQRQTRTYNVHNVDAKKKSLIIQQEGVANYSIISPKPVERTATAYRFAVDLPANGNQTLKVEEEQNIFDGTAIASATPDFLLTVLENKQLNANNRNELQAILDLKRRIADLTAQLEQNKSRLAELREDQTRLRQNIDSLNRVKGQEDQVRKYSAQLATNEEEIVKLRNDAHDLETKKSGADAELRHNIEVLNF